MRPVTVPRYSPVASGLVDPRLLPEHDGVGEVEPLAVHTGVARCACSVSSRGDQPSTSLSNSEKGARLSSGSPATGAVAPAGAASRATIRPSATARATAALPAERLSASTCADPRPAPGATTTGPAGCEPRRGRVRRWLRDRPRLVNGTLRSHRR